MQVLASTVLMVSNAKVSGWLGSIASERHTFALMNHVDTLTHASNQVPSVSQLTTALISGVSVLITHPTGAALLAAAGPVLARTRVRVLQPRSPLDLIASMHLAPLALPRSGRMGLEQGFDALTVLDPTCDHIALLINDAHLLSQDALHYVELALGAGPHLSVALAGRPELADTLALDDFTGLRKRLRPYLIPGTPQSPSSAVSSRNNQDQHTVPTGTIASLPAANTRFPSTEVWAKEALSTDKQPTIPGQPAVRSLPGRRSLARTMAWFWGGLFGVACTGAIALELLGPPTHRDHVSNVVPLPAQAANTPAQVSSIPAAPALPDPMPLPAVKPSASEVASLPAQATNAQSQVSNSLVASAPDMSPALAAGLVAPGEALDPGKATAPRMPLEPEMILLPGTAFQMGSNDDRSEQPVHAVTVKPFSIAKYATTVREWQQCVQAKVCSVTPKGQPDEPMTNVSWDDARQFVDWLSSTTGQPYRLPTEAEWEYAARAGTETRYSWGNALLPGKVSCKDCGTPISLQNPPWVYAYPPNPFGLYGMGGGVAEWVADCWHRNYQNAPYNGSVPWDAPDCRARVLRGGSWVAEASYLRVSSRESYDVSVRYPTHGFRAVISK